MINGMIESVVVVQRHIANHDVNGNPRRLWVFTAIELNVEMPITAITAIYDEGYVGWPHGIGSRMDFAELPSVNISISEYKVLKKSTAFKG
jgi:hypothetical protein